MYKITFRREKCMILVNIPKEKCKKAIFILKNVGEIDKIIKIVNDFYNLA